MSGNPTLHAIAAGTEIIGLLWINAIRMTVVPLVMALLIVSVAGFSDLRSAGRTGGRALLLFVTFVVGFTFFALLVVPPLFHWLPIEPATAAALGEFSTSSNVRDQAQQLPGVTQWLIELVPVNPIRAAVDGAMLPLVVFSILFGLATSCIATDLREALVRFFHAVSETMLTLVRWLIALAPIGVFALIVPLASRLGASAAGAFGYYVIVMSGLMLLQTLLLYPIAAVFGRIPVKRFAQAVFPAQAVAFSSRSSLASLPALLQGAEKSLECPPQVVGFVLPLAVSIFKVSSPIVWLTGAFFIAQLYGVHLGAAQVGLILVASVVLSFSSPGIPLGSLLLLVPVFASAGLPVEGIGILMAIDLLPDAFKTVANVTGDMAVAAVIARRSRAAGDTG